jgi:hypothetical protein
VRGSEIRRRITRRLDEARLSRPRSRVAPVTLCPLYDMYLSQCQRDDALAVATDARQRHTVLAVRKLRKLRRMAPFAASTLLLWALTTQQWAFAVLSLPLFFIFRLAQGRERPIYRFLILFSWAECILCMIFAPFWVVSGHQTARHIVDTEHDPWRKAGATVLPVLWMFAARGSGLVIIRAPMHHFFGQTAGILFALVLCTFAKEQEMLAFGHAPEALSAYRALFAVASIASVLVMGKMHRRPSTGAEDEKEFFRL